MSVEAVSWTEREVVLKETSLSKLAADTVSASGFKFYLFGAYWPISACFSNFFYKQ